MTRICAGYWILQKGRAVNGILTLDTLLLLTKMVLENLLILRRKEMNIVISKRIF